MRKMIRRWQRERRTKERKGERGKGRESKRDKGKEMARTREEINRGTRKGDRQMSTRGTELQRSIFIIIIGSNCLRCSCCPLFVLSLLVCTIPSL